MDQGFAGLIERERLQIVEHRKTLRSAFGGEKKPRRLASIVRSRCFVRCFYKLRTTEAFRAIENSPATQVLVGEWNWPKPHCAFYEKGKGFQDFLFSLSTPFKGFRRQKKPSSGACRDRVSLNLNKVVTCLPNRPHLSEPATQTYEASS
jgi:hypothetical protein